MPSLRDDIDDWRKKIDAQMANDADVWRADIDAQMATAATQPATQPPPAPGGFQFGVRAGAPTATIAPPAIGSTSPPVGDFGDVGALADYPGAQRVGAAPGSGPTPDTPFALYGDPRPHIQGSGSGFQANITPRQYDAYDPGVSDFERAVAEAASGALEIGQFPFRAATAISQATEAAADQIGLRGPLDAFSRGLRRIPGVEAAEGAAATLAGPSLSETLAPVPVKSRLGAKMVALGQTVSPIGGFFGLGGANVPLRVGQKLSQKAVEFLAKRFGPTIQRVGGMSAFLTGYGGSQMLPEVLGGEMSSTDFLKHSLGAGPYLAVDLAKAPFEVHDALASYVTNADDEQAAIEDILRVGRAAQPWTVLIGAHLSQAKPIRRAEQAVTEGVAKIPRRLFGKRTAPPTKPPVIPTGEAAVEPPPVLPKGVPAPGKFDKPEPPKRLQVPEETRTRDAQGREFVSIAPPKEKPDALRQVAPEEVKVQPEVQKGVEAAPEAVKEGEVGAAPKGEQGRITSEEFFRRQALRQLHGTGKVPGPEVLKDYPDIIKAKNDWGVTWQRFPLEFLKRVREGTLPESLKPPPKPSFVNPFEAKGKAPATVGPPSVPPVGAGKPIPPGPEPGAKVAPPTVPGKQPKPEPSAPTEVAKGQAVVIPEGRKEGAGAPATTLSPRARLAEIARKRGYDQILRRGQKGFANQRNKRLVAMREADTQYQAALGAAKRESMGVRTKDTKAEKVAERAQADREASAGVVSSDVMKYTPVHELPTEVRSAIQGEAKGLLNQTKSKATKAALQKIVDDAGKDVGAAVEKQKERIVGILGGELDQRTIFEKQIGAPQRPAHPLIELLGEKDQKVRKNIIDQAINDHKQGNPNPLVDAMETPFSSPSEIVSMLRDLAKRAGVGVGGKIKRTLTPRKEGLAGEIQRAQAPDKGVTTGKTKPLLLGGEDVTVKPEKPARGPEDVPGQATFAPPKPKLFKQAPVVSGEPVSGTTPSRQAVKRSMEPAAEPIKASKIIGDVSKALDIPIRVGHFRQRAFGIFKVKPEVIRTREANDLVTTAHEIGHGIEKKVFGRRPGRPLHFDPWKNELVALGKALYGDKAPKGGYAREGFAEYMRYYTLTNEAGIRAPEFHKNFEAEFLPRNPAVAKAIVEFKANAKQWRDQGAVARVLSQISFSGEEKKPPIRERAKRAVRVAQTLFTDHLLPLERAERAMTGGKLLSAGESPTKIARFVDQSAGAMAREWVREGATDIHGNTIGPGLKQILTPVAEDMRSFLAYAYARRGVELWERDINPGIDRADSKFVEKKLRSPAFTKAADQLAQWNDNLLQYLVSAGGLSPEASQVIRDSNAAYIPLKRVFVDAADQAPTRTKRGFADLGQPVKRIKGSGREIVDPREAMVAYAEQIIGTANKIRVGRALVNMAKNREGVGKWVEKVDPPMQAQGASLKDLKSQLEAKGVDLSRADMDAVLTVYSQSPRYFGKDNIVSFWENGKRSFYEVDPELYRSIKGLDQAAWPWWADLPISAPTRAIRLGAVGLRPGFTMFTNPVRDAWTFFLQSEATSGLPHHIVKGLKDVAVRSEVFKKWRAAGGELAQPLGMDRKSIRAAVEEATASSAKRKALHIVRHPVELLKEVFSFTEAAPRIAEFEATLRKRGWKPGDLLKDGDLVEAINAANDVTVNFKRGGIVGRQLNRAIAFFNPTVQGLSKAGRTAFAHPGKTMFRAMAALTAPTLAYWWANKDEKWYQELPDWQKYGYWNFKIGDKIIKIPRPFEWGYAFASIPEGVADSIYRKDPEAAKTAIKEAIEAASPGAIPSLAQPLIEAGFDYKFLSGAPIVGRSLGRLEDQDQFKPYTTETAKLIGAIFNASPAKIEHILGGYTGGLVPDVIRQGEKGLRAAGVLEPKPPGQETAADLPIAGRLFARAKFSGQARSITLLYKELADLRAKQASAKKRGTFLKGTGATKLRVLERAANSIAKSRAKAVDATAKERERIWEDVVDMVRRKRAFNAGLQKE